MYRFYVCSRIRPRPLQKIHCCCFGGCSFSFYWKYSSFRDVLCTISGWCFSLYSLALDSNDRQSTICLAVKRSASTFVWKRWNILNVTKPQIKVATGKWTQCSTVSICTIYTWKWYVSSIDIPELKTLPIGRATRIFCAPLFPAPLPRRVILVSDCGVTWRLGILWTRLLHGTTVVLLMIVKSLIPREIRDVWKGRATGKRIV